MAVSISISVTQNSQSVANNTSNITVKVTAKWTNGSYNAVVDSGGTPQAKGWLKIDGTSYSFASTFNTGKTTSGSQTIFTKTVDVSHGSDGTKTVATSASYTTGVSSGTVTASASKALTTIPRKSTLSVSNGTLGTAQTLTITEKTSTFKHKLQYSCGSASGYILGGSSSYSTSNSVSWTPPLSLAQQNTTGTSVSVKFTLTTYTSDGTSVGSNNYTKTFSIPESVAPTVSIAVSDASECATIYGAYIKGYSKFKVTVTASGSQESTIKSYKTTANGKTYTTALVTTGVLSNSGTLTISTTVTDSRGRTATASTKVSVLAYSPPKIGSFSVSRCDAAGNTSSSGEYLMATFNGSVTALNNNNTPTYTIQYKKFDDTAYTSVTLDDYADDYSVTSGTYIFAADTASSYEVILTIADDFESVSRTANGSSVRKLLSILDKSTGLALGKVAELADTFDVNFLSIFRKDVCVGNKEGYLDGKDGIFLDAEGFMHLQRTSANGYHPYIGFFIDGATDSNGLIRVNCTNNHMEFLNAAAYQFGNTVMLGNKTDYQDGKTGVYLHRAGYMHLQRASSDGNPYIGFYLDSATTAGANILLNASNGYLQFKESERYTFDNALWVGEGIYTDKSIRIGASDTTALANRNISMYWADFGAHSIVERTADGLTSAFGWVGSSTHSTITKIRGRTCQYQNSSGTTALSDERMKKDFTDLEKWEAFFDAIEPCAFKMKAGTSGRFHLGFKAQQVEQALFDTGLTAQDFAGFVKMPRVVDEDDHEGNAAYEEAGIKPGDDEFGLIYTEFVALNTYKIQKLQAEVNSLKDEVAELKKQVQALLAAQNGGDIL